MVRWLLLSLMLTSQGPSWAEERPRFVVVLDAGHGGSNTGAPGVVEGVYEKRVTLVLAKQIARRLQEAGLEVRLTRTDDRYLTLRERVRWANAQGADLFVSVHANASPSRGQRGFETYVLAPEALDVDTRALRSGDGAPRPSISAETAAILDDLERAASVPVAVRVAQRIQARLSEARGKGADRGVRTGTMDVLMGPVMPAVLVEVGFIDHPVEGVELLRREVREAIAAAIAQAILDHRLAALGKH
jgi:N-acetylmuramoyl-L-alanine amidase